MVDLIDTGCGPTLPKLLVDWEYWDKVLFTGFLLCGWGVIGPVSLDGVGPDFFFADAGLGGPIEEEPTRPLRGLFLIDSGCLEDLEDLAPSFMSRRVELLSGDGVKALLTGAGDNPKPALTGDPDPVLFGRGGMYFGAAMMLISGQNLAKSSVGSTSIGSIPSIANVEFMRLSACFGAGAPIGLPRSHCSSSLATKVMVSLKPLVVAVGDSASNVPSKFGLAWTGVAGMTSGALCCVHTGSGGTKVSSNLRRLFSKGLPSSPDARSAGLFGVPECSS